MPGGDSAHEHDRMPGWIKDEPPEPVGKEVKVMVGLSFLSKFLPAIWQRIKNIGR